MNILPKKRWHVRTKDNIARVRRDEAEAREQEEKRLEKLKYAESEARINFLRRQSGLPERSNTSTDINNDIPSNSAEHIDLFADYKSHVKKSNQELEKEQKEEREKYEKQIGYLTYLGQDTNEALKLRSWYEVAPSRSKHTTDIPNLNEKDLKTKFIQDPLTLINTLLPKEKKPKVTPSTKAQNFINLKAEPSDDCEQQLAEKHVRRKHKKEKKSKHKKKEKIHKKDKRHEKKKELEAKEKQKREMIERLRKERLKREQVERARQEELLNPKQAIAVEPEKKASGTRVVQKYNSQFNPELAKQNIS